tara:strand:+ start:14814 stop:15266 length:453 start_codon:yes stop_codon:yes gene_type:complete
MIVRVTFEDLERKELKYLFGNGYKSWRRQYEEFVYDYITWWDKKTIMTCNLFNILQVETSSSEWIKSGGLKWCSDKIAQDELNEELIIAKRQGEKRKTARKYNQIKFTKNHGSYKYYCQKTLSNRLRHLSVCEAEQIKQEVRNYSSKKNA